MADRREHASQNCKLTQNPLQSPFYEDFCNKFNNSNFKFSTICYETVSTCFYKDELKWNFAQDTLDDNSVLQF